VSRSRIPPNLVSRPNLALKYDFQNVTQACVHTEDKDSEDDREYDYDNRGIAQLIPSRPAHLGHLGLDIAEVICDLIKHCPSRRNSRPGGIRTPNTRFWRPVL
jgi:hypothetical protein